VAKLQYMARDSLLEAKECNISKRENGDRLNFGGSEDQNSANKCQSDNRTRNK